jgi:hypothetical protein
LVPEEAIWFTEFHRDTLTNLLKIFAAICIY